MFWYGALLVLLELFVIVEVHVLLEFQPQTVSVSEPRKLIRRKLDHLSSFRIGEYSKTLNDNGSAWPNIE